MSDTQQIFQSDIFVRLSDLTPDERTFVIDAQKGILATRFQEAALNAEIARIRLQYAKDEVAYSQTMHERQLADAQEYHRPSHAHYIAVSFDEERGLFQVAYSEIRAYGDTPEAACRNFDQLWQDGHYRQTI